MTTRNRVRRFVRGARRATRWLDTIVNESIVNVASVADNLDSNISQGDKKGMTLVRMILELNLSAAGTGTGALLHAGIFLLHGDAKTAGVYADPEDQAEQAGYLWRWTGTCFTSAVNDRSQQTQIKADLKSRRKYPSEDHELVLYMKATSSSITVNVDGLIRTLWLLP